LLYSNRKILFRDVYRSPWKWATDCVGKKAKHCCLVRFALFYHQYFFVGLLLLVAFAFGACGGEPAGHNSNGISYNSSVPQLWNRELDLLIVLDNSSSMMDEHAFNISAIDSSFVWFYVGMNPVNIHVGVVSTDLGVSPYSFDPSCEDGGGQGVLDGADCLTGSGENYLIDVWPRGCSIVRERQNGAFSCHHDCTQVNCQHEPSTSFHEDYVTGCPRCLNYQIGSLGDNVPCLTDAVGRQGCGFKQPLEAMRTALADNSANTGFLREGAMLGVVIITDEDDCSASNPEVFSDEQDSIDSLLGFQTPFRCFEFGVSCANNDRAFVGNRYECVAREDGGGYLHGVSRYVDFLKELKDPQLISVAVLTGPTGDGTVETGMDAEGRPALLSSCTTSSVDARPGVRLSSFVSRLAESGDFQLSTESICDLTMENFMVMQGQAIMDQVKTFDCLPAPLLGCSDVAAWWDQEGDGEDCNDVCQPECMVIDVQSRGTLDEVQEVIPRCVEVDPSGGIMVGNVRKDLAYAAGYPGPVDALLPVSACWYVDYAPDCYESRYSTIKVSRRSADIHRAFLEIRCLQGTLVEEDCTDGVDNDEDCRTDMEDDECH